MLWLTAIQLIYAQERILKGTVVDEQSKAPIAGATVKLIPNNKATATDDSGNFTIEVPAGYNQVNQSITPADTSITISLAAAQANKIDDVVVTAMGVQRKAKSLSYSTQTVKGEELTKVKDANPMNNLTGKVSGMQINRSSSRI